MYFVGFWKFEFDVAGLCGSRFVPIAFFCERKQAVAYARAFVLEHLSALATVWDMETKKASYFSLFKHQQETEKFNQSVVYSSVIDCDVNVGLYANEGTLLHQLLDSLNMFHVEHFTTKM